MARKKKNGDKGDPIQKVALISAIICLVNSIVELVVKLINIFTR